MLYRLIWPVVLVLVVSLLSVALIAFFLAKNFDVKIQANERTVLEVQLSNGPQRLRAVAEDNAWWDDAVDNIHLAENEDWIYSIIGEAVWSFDNIDGGFIVQPDDSISHRFDQLEQIPDIQAMLDNGLARAISELESGNFDNAISSAGYVFSENSLFMVALSMVQPFGGTVYDPPITMGRREVIVFFQRVDPEDAIRMGEAITLFDLQFQPGDTVPSEGHQLENIVQQPIGHFSWTPSSPGTDLLGKLIVPAILLLGMALLAMAMFIVRARRLVEELKQADRTKMAFLASMSHEVRTPLNAIIGFAEIVRMELHGEIQGDKNKEYLDIIRSSGEHLLTVINDILNISKLDAGKMEVFAEAMDPVEIIEQSVNMVENSANDRSIRLVKELESSMIISDERIIRQILVNLLSNAIKFTPAGGQVAVRSEIVDGGYKIIVADTGIGMSKEDIEQALEPFGQVHHGKNNVGGTGLGLPLVNRFLELLGGSMTIRSAPAHGTSVTVELPEAAPKSKDTAAAEDQLI
ncbi:MAG: hypothetical protein JJ850_04090 [Kordiimonadaceae bacterium]|nr:hypothetical protein [Kordiimonadaceae bacterium]MBO6568502.1 hypothetical protein [Kordiimonadaceae bacterium]MBO6963769.1 hypothetical protein [Kordiimonadaceae bacterium]